MKKSELLSDIRVAWLIPSMERGFCWLPLLEEFANIFPSSTVFTGLWPRNQSSKNLSFNLKVVGKTRFIKLGMKGSSYEKGIIIPPIDIPFYLLKFLPHVIIVVGFSFWTIIAILLKPFTKWRVIILYEGSAPTIDSRESKLRIFERRLIIRLTDALMTNSLSGESYLVQFLKANKERVFARPYLVPDSKRQFLKEVNVETLLRDTKRPVFLYVGLIIQRKGLKFLIKALSSLKRKGCDNTTLVIVGDGPQREELENMIKEEGMEKQVIWVGWVDYASLGYCFKSSDIFVLPSFEDTWGLVVLEAMAFGMPVLCSELAGASEMVATGQNGYTFNPARDRPEELAEIMRRFIDDPDLIRRMGENSKQLVSSHTPKAVANFLKNIIELVLEGRDGSSIRLSEYQERQH